MRGERELVVHRIDKPAPGVIGGHPAPPLDDEIGGDEILQDGRRDDDEGERQKDAEELMPELDAMGLVGNLDGVAEIVLEEVEPDPQRDLELVDEDQRHHRPPRVKSLGQREAAGQRRTKEDRRPGLEERVGDRHHLAHQRDAVDQGEHDDEHRGRQRQITRDRVFLYALRPEADETDDVGETEEHRLDGEQLGHYPQERRERNFWPRQDGANRRGDAEQNRHGVGMRKADDEREDREGGEDQSAHGQSGRACEKRERLRPPSRLSAAKEGRGSRDNVKCW